MKPVKIRLSQGDLRAQGMYILLEEDEEKYTKTGITSPPNRIYKIEIAVETVVNNKRCRGKRSFNIPKGTSITKAIESLLGKKDELIKTLRDKGSLKTEKIVIEKNIIYDYGTGNFWHYLILIATPILFYFSITEYIKMRKIKKTSR